MSGDLPVHQQVRRESTPTALENLLGDIATLKEIPVETVTELHRIHRLEVEDARRVEFDEAKARVQDRLKDLPVVKDTPGVHGSKFAKVEKICAVLDPLLAGEGFSWAISEADSTLPNHVRIVLTLRRAGHEERYYYSAPVEAPGRGSSALQVSGGRHTYAGRKLRVNVFGVHEVDDLDGADPTATDRITAEQADDLQSTLDELQVDRARFLSTYGVERLEDLTKANLQGAHHALAQRRRMHR